MRAGYLGDMQSDARLDVHSRPAHSGVFFGGLTVVALVAVAWVLTS